MLTPTYNYDTPENNYSTHRKADPRIAAYIHKALGDAQTILNVGAGTGSYEPTDRYVVALEPSERMRAQRIALGRTPAVIGFADALPFDDASFDATMACYTVHHWPDMAKGLRELRRVTKGPVVVMTGDPDSLYDFWNYQYFPEVVEAEKRRYPRVDFITATLGGHCEVWKIPVPLDCTDGFQEAFYGRPEAFLQKEIRQSQSAWGFITEELEMRYVEKLANDLASGEWDRLYGHYRTQPEFICSLRVIIGMP